MASKSDKGAAPQTEDTKVPRLSESMGLAEALAANNPGLAARLARKDAQRGARRLTEEQEGLLAQILLSPKDAFGARDRTRKLNLRLGKSVRERMEAFLDRNPRVEQSLFVEFAIHRLLEDLGD